MSEKQLLALLETREREKEALRIRTGRKLTRGVLIIGGALAILCICVSLIIEWYRVRHPRTGKLESLSSQLGIDPETASFAEELFHFVVLPGGKPAPAPSESPGKLPQPP